MIMKHRQTSICGIFIFSIVFSVLSISVGHPSRNRQNVKLHKHLNTDPFENSFEDGKIPTHLMDIIHGARMGISSDTCDNAMDKLDVDWDGSASNFTCYAKELLPTIEWLRPKEKCYLPNFYIAKHLCMSENISYEDPIPTYGSHRPLWPVYGEYVFLPPQRWLHTLEHGGIVMLYHPCADSMEIEHLRLLLKNCLRRYVISPYFLLPENRPLALLSWGCKLLMNTVDETIAVQFIKARALHAPEGKLAKDGQYNYTLIERSYVVPGSTFKDSNLCPNL